MRKPSVHLNGTSREMLSEQFTKAKFAIGEAAYTLSAAAPNARDYYVQGNEAFAEAAAEHRNRLSDLMRIMRELEELAIHVDGAGRA